MAVIAGNVEMRSELSEAIIRPLTNTKGKQRGRSRYYQLWQNLPF